MKKTGIKVKSLVFLLIVFLTAASSISFIYADNSQKEIQKNSTKTIIRVGYTENGQMIRKADGRFTGYGPAYLNMLTEYTGWQIIYVPVTDENRIQMLKDGKIDLLCDVSEEEAGLDEVLLSDEGSSVHFCLIYAKEDDNSIFYGEYKALNGKRIALNSSRKMEHMLKEFSEDNHFNYTPVFCSSVAEMETAVKEGRADLLVASNMREMHGYKYVAKMGMRDQFFAVSASRPDLMKALNFANRQIKQERPFIIASLYETYYGRPSEVLTGTTREEYNFIVNQTPVRVLCDADSYPISYFDKETGEYCGIYADMLKLIQEKSGLNFQFIPTEEYRDSWQMLKDGKADMNTGVYAGKALMKKYNLITSPAYIHSSYAMIMKAGKAPGANLKIALPKNYIGIQAFVKENYPDWVIIQGKDPEDCLKMTQMGTAEATIINSVFMQTIYNLNNYPSLVALPMHTVDISLSSVFAGPNAKLLDQIFTKAISKIPAEKFNKCIIENSVKIVYEPSLMNIFHRILPLILVILAAFACLYLLTLWNRERHYRRLALTDSVTGLWNGICFRKKCDELLAHNPQKEYLLIAFDLDHFKYVNNDFGRQAANSVLKTLADRLRNLLDTESFYAREMADIFVILAEKKGNPDIISRLTTNLADDIYFINNGITHVYKPDIRYGIYEIAAGNEARSRVSVYIDYANTARKSIKEHPTEKLAYFNQKMADEMEKISVIEKKMENALREKQFEVFYQPKYHLADDTIFGAEALVRWKDPEEGMIFPNDFIPIFEHNGFIIPLDFFVYEEVLKALSKWRSEGKPHIVVSVNVSRAHIGTLDFLPKLSALADSYHVPHDLLELELTETLVGGKRQDVITFIKNCKAEGFPISIDDFGSGYSSLNLLKDLPVDVLKIDREFLNESEVSEKTSVIIEQIVDMAAKLKVHTLCEGIETKEQAVFLKKIGCEAAQGYLYSKPVPLAEFEKLLVEKEHKI